MILYSYWRSTTSYRVRAALNLKGLCYETVSVDLTTGAQKNADYRALNPNAGVPTLVLDDETVLVQSLAIIDYLDAVYPEPRLIPADPLVRAKVIALAHSIALDIHPINNLRVMEVLKSEFGATEDHRQHWMRHWMREGFEAVEKQLSKDTLFAFGDAPELADLCIGAQCYNAHRWGVKLAPFPKIMRVEAACLAHPAIVAAHPDNNQPDGKQKI